MITAISGYSGNKSQNNLTSIKRAPQINFAGSPINLVKSEGRVSKFAEHAVDLVGRGYRKLFGNGELPFSKKPLSADADLTHFLPDGTPITIPMPELHTNVTKFLDGSNILEPDAADLAASMDVAIPDVPDLAHAAAEGLSDSGADAAGAAVEGFAHVVQEHADGAIDALSEIGREILKGIVG